MANGNNNQIEDNSHNLLRLGEQLQGGKYRVDRYLASGGFGNTYLVTNTLLDIPLVIKEFYIKGVTSRTQDGRTVTVSLPENRAMWDKMLEKFKREARHMFKINHPNIVRVHDFFEENDTAYYVMDLVAGESLRERMERTGRPVTETELVGGILPQVLAALERIHSENIWHLDIKPANLMQERGGTVKLIDFGASKQSEPGEGATTTGLAYTPGYASPEQIAQNPKAIGPWSDFYSLGATLYNLLTRRTPPSQSDIDDDGDEAFGYTGVSVSERLRNLIGRMMLTPRRLRPQSVADIKQLLAAPVPTVYPAATPKRTATVTPTPQPQPQRPEPKRPEPKRPEPVAKPVDDEKTVAVDSQTPKPVQRAPQAAAVGAVTADKSQNKRRGLIVAAVAAVALLLAGTITFFALRLGNDDAPSIELPSEAIDPADITPDDASQQAPAADTVPMTEVPTQAAPAPQPTKQTAAKPQRATTQTQPAKPQNSGAQRQIQQQQSAGNAAPRSNNANVHSRHSGNSSVNERKNEPNRNFNNIRDM